MIKIILSVLFCLLFNPIAIAAPPIEAYGRLPGVEMMQISPSGKQYAFIAVFGESRRLGVVSDTGKPILFTELEDLKVRRIDWVGEDRLLLWSSSTFSNLMIQQSHELSAVANIDLKTRKVTHIFANSQRVANTVLGYAGTARVNDHDYGYFVGITLVQNMRQGEYEFINDHRDLYQVDLESNEVTRVARGGDGPSYAWAVNTDGSVIAHSENDQENGIWRLYAGEGRAKLLVEKSTTFNDVDLIGLGRTPNTVWISDSSSGVAVTEEISVSDGQSELIFKSLSPDTYLSDPNTGLGIGAITLENPHAYFFDEKLQARIKGTRKAFPNLQMQLISFSHDLDRLIVKTDGGNDSGTYWLVDIASGKADPLGYPYPEIRAADVGPIQEITYKASDGMDIQAILTLPPGRKPENLPLVVLPHGGPIGVNDALHFDWWAQAYASAGYAVLQPNYRGSGGKGADFIAAGYGEWGRKMQTDLSDGVAALTTQGVINPKRVCIVGASYGGYAALAGVTLQHDIYRCAVSVAGPANLPTFFKWEVERHGLHSGATRYWRAVTGANKDSYSVMKTISPTQFADHASAPILLIHGKDDTVVPITQSEQMASALRSANKPVEFIEMKGEDHWLSRDETRKTMLKASVAFVLKHNPPDSGSY